MAQINGVLKFATIQVASAVIQKNVLVMVSTYHVKSDKLK